MDYSLEVVTESVRRHREESGLSQREAALKSGVNYQTLSNYENGNTGMSFESAWKLANLYGCSLDDLGGRARGEVA